MAFQTLEPSSEVLYMLFRSIFSEIQHFPKPISTQSGICLSLLKYCNRLLFSDFYNRPVSLHYTNFGLLLKGMVNVQTLRYFSLQSSFVLKYDGTIYFFRYNHTDRLPEPIKEKLCHLPVIIENLAASPKISQSR